MKSFRVLILAALMLGGCAQDGGVEDAGGDGGSNVQAAAEACESQGDSISVTAETGATNAFSADCLAVPAGQEVSLELENPDNEPHNLSVLEAEGGEKLFNGEFVNPGENGTYSIPGLEPGDLYFQCDIHPEMNGEFRVV